MDVDYDLLRTVYQRCRAGGGTRVYGEVGERVEGRRKVEGREVGEACVCQGD